MSEHRIKPAKRQGGGWKAARGVVAVLCVWATLAAARAAADEPALSAERWSENAYGVSLRPPLGTRLLERSADDAVVRILAENDYAITVFIKKRDLDNLEPIQFKSDQPTRVATVERPAPAAPGRGPRVRDLSVGEVVEESIRQLAAAQPGARILEDKDKPPPKLVVPGHEAGLVYFSIPVPKSSNLGRGFLQSDPNRRLALGQAFIKLDKLTFVMLQLECQFDKLGATRPIFEAVARSVEAADPKQLEAKRRAQAEAGQDWRTSLKINQLRTALVPEQLFRILQDGKEIGFMRVLQKADKQVGTAGLRVDVEFKTRTGAMTCQSSSNMFLSNDGLKEVWTIRTEVKGLAGAAPPRLGPGASSTAGRAAPGATAAPTQGGDQAAWNETGLRSGEQITVTREGPEGRKQYQWDRPRAEGGEPRPYLSMVEVQLLDRILPHQAPQDLGFYAYNANAGRISFRTERIEPAAATTPGDGGGGGWKVYSRPTPDAPEQVSTFDAAGNLVQRQLPNGQVILPATAAEVAKWRTPPPGGSPQG